MTKLSRRSASLILCDSLYAVVSPCLFFSFFIRVLTDSCIYAWDFITWIHFLHDLKLTRLLEKACQHQTRIKAVLGGVSLCCTLEIS